MKKNILSFIFLIVVSSQVFSQEKTAEILLNNFFSKYQKAPNTALTYLFSTNSSYYEKNKESIDDFIKKYQTEYITKLGNFYGYKKLPKDEVFYDSLIKYQYVLNYDDLPLLFEITLYKPKDVWMLYNFTYITNFGLPKKNSEENKE